jgi:hypothetical protein
MYTQRIIITTIAALDAVAVATTVSAQSTCGTFTLRLAEGDIPLQVVENGTVTLAPMNSTEAASDFSFGSNGAIESQVNDTTTVRCGFPSDGNYFECGTEEELESREDDSELVFDFATSDDGRLSWRGNETFWLCNAVESGFASNDLPAWDIILAGTLENELVLSSVTQICQTVEIIASDCDGFSAEDGEDDDDDDDDSESTGSGSSNGGPAVQGNTGGTVDTSAGEAEDGSANDSGATALGDPLLLWVAVAALWTLL